MAIAANLTIPILRQDYRDAAQIAASAAAQYNGWVPNKISGELAAAAEDISGYTTSETTYKATIPADFKDHKTVFVFINNFAATKTVTFKAGDSDMGSQDLTVTVPIGTSVMWLDSARFVNKATGLIEVKTDAAETDSKYVKMIGYEMR